ncbi:MAG: glutamate racemase [Alistipes sp.]|nr:glutamate racemase [Alistipes sp.]
MIGVFDSGLGGLSVWQALHNALPHESLIYLGDGARCPYGSRSSAEVRQFTEEAVERLLAEGCKMVVLACNTATAVAIKYLRDKYPNVPFVGLEPAVKPAALTTKSGVIGVLATERSLQGEHLRRNEERYGSTVKILKAVGEGFVEAVEQNEEQSPATEELVRKVVEPIVMAGADKIVLGCTHYPFLREVIERVAGDGVEIIDSSEAVARRVAALLDENGIRAEESAEAEYRFLTFADEAYAEKLKAKAFCRIEKKKETIK